ncbi:MAG TPA: hypothetical protein VE907_09920 [Gammaproteobacteria bacterium]|nr:hypothetical protein [Gammaproteobacteria bacterium]
MEPAKLGSDPALAAFLGTWSSPLTSQDDPAWSVEDFYCFAACTAGGRASAAALLRDPANARRPTLELLPEAAAANARDAVRLLTPGAAARTAPPATALARAARFACSPDGFVSQVLSPLPLAIELAPGRVVLHYEEFGARRAIHLGGHHHGPAAAAPFGVSTARLESGTLVVETSGIPPGRLYGAFGSLPHGERLSAVERYTVSGDGRWLDLTLELTDPDTLREPLVLTKRWRRAEHETLRSHGCDVLSAGLDGVVFEYLDPAKVDARRR